VRKLSSGVMHTRNAKVSFATDLPFAHAFAIPFAASLFGGSLDKHKPGGRRSQRSSALSCLSGHRCHSSKASKPSIKLSFAQYQTPKPVSMAVCDSRAVGSHYSLVCGTQMRRQYVPVSWRQSSFNVAVMRPASLMLRFAARVPCSMFCPRLSHERRNSCYLRSW